MSRPVRVRLTLHPKVAAHLLSLLKTGLYGRNLTKVVEGLMLRSLRDELGIKG